MFMANPMFGAIKIICFGIAAYGMITRDMNWILYGIFADSFWRDFYEPAPIAMINLDDGDIENGD